MNKLYEAFNFSHADLRANHQGQLTDHQHTILKRWAYTTRNWILVFALVVGVGAVLLPAPINYFLFLTFLIFAYFVMRSWLGLRQDIAGRQLASVTGKSKLHNWRQSLYLEMDGRYFWLTQRQYRTLKRGQRYRVYYLPFGDLHTPLALSLIGAGVIVSIEPL